MRVFIGPPLFSPVEEVDFPMSVNWSRKRTRNDWPVKKKCSRKYEIYYVNFNIVIPIRI